MKPKINIIEVDKSIILFIAIDKLSNEVVGRCSLKLRENKTIRYQDALVDEKHRGKGIYKHLFYSRERYIRKKFKNHVIESYCKDSTVNMFLENGFNIDSKLYLVKKDRIAMRVNMKAV